MEQEILASVDTKSIGRMGWLEARQLVEWAPLMHWIEGHMREKDKLHLIQAMVRVGLPVRWGMGIEYSHVRKGTLKTPSP